MPVVADVSTQSAVKKLQHAFALRDQFRDLLAALLSERREVRREDNSAERSPTVWAQWVLESIPDCTEVALVLGDVVHNLRAAVDHAMWAATPEHVQLKSPTEIAFPLYTHEAHYQKWAHKRRNWYRPKVFDVVRYAQPFNAVGTGTLHPLHILQFLSNTDKHRLLNIVAHSQVDLGGVVVNPPPPGGVQSTVNNGVVQPGSILARVEFRRPAEKAAVDLTPTFAYEQVFRYIDQDHQEHWLPIGEAMNEIGPHVVDAVFGVLAAHEANTSE
jgi:hypothetical protein